MVLWLHEQRYSSYSLLSCHLFCLFDSTFLYLKVYFTLILNKLMETPLLTFAYWGGQQGRVMSQIMYTEDINKGYLKCSSLTEKQSCKHLEMHIKA